MLRVIIAVAVMVGLAQQALADERPGMYIKDGKLVETLEVLELQGGFAGFTGTYTTVEKDGTWSTGPMLPRDQRGVATKSGKLDAKQLASLAKALAQHDLANLPSAGKPVTNPEITTISFGEHSATLMPEAKDPKIVARYEGIVEAVKEATGEDKK